MAKKHPGEDTFKNEEIALAFREVVCNILGKYCIDHTWVCNLKARPGEGFVVNPIDAPRGSFRGAGAIDESSPYSGDGGSWRRRRRLQVVPDDEYEDINVSFLVSTKVGTPGSGCTDARAQAKLARAISARVHDSVENGELEEKLRAKNTGTFLDDVVVEKGNNFSPSSPSRTKYNHKSRASESERQCVILDEKEKSLLDKQTKRRVILAAFSFLVVFTCCCWYLFCRKKREVNSREGGLRPDLEMSNVIMDSPVNPIVTAQLPQVQNSPREKGVKRSSTSSRAAGTKGAKGKPSKPRKPSKLSSSRSSTTTRGDPTSSRSSVGPRSSTVARDVANSSARISSFEKMSEDRKSNKSKVARESDGSSPPTPGKIKRLSSRISSTLSSSVRNTFIGREEDREPEEKLGPYY